MGNPFFQEPHHPPPPDRRVVNGHLGILIKAIENNCAQLGQASFDQVRI